jgi:hypothetical protein
MDNGMNLHDLHVERRSLGREIQALELKQWDIAVEIAKRICPAKVGHILKGNHTGLRYKVISTGAHSVADKKLVADWHLRVRVLNKDGTVRRRTKPQQINRADFVDFVNENAIQIVAVGMK